MIIINNEFKVLIVDDNFIQRKILHKLLTDLGISVIDAQNAKDAINLVSNTDFKLIIIDYYLPSMPVFDLVQELNDITKEKTQNKIVLASTDTFKVSKDELEKNKILDIIQKPYQISDLENLIVKHIVHSEQGKEEPIFNIKEFINIYESIDMQKEIIDAMLDEKENDLKRMEDAFDSEDLDIIYKALHYMKGSFSYLKASRVLKLTQKLLDAAKEKNLKEVLNLKENIINNYHVLLEELERYKQSL